VHTRRSDERSQVWTSNFQWKGKPYFVAREPRQTAPEHPPQLGGPDDDHPAEREYSAKSRDSVFKRLRRKGRNLEELREAHRNNLLRAVSRVRLFGSDKSRELREVFVKLSVVEDYAGLPGDSQLMGLMDAGLRRKLSVFSSGSLDPDSFSLNSSQDAVRTVSPDDLLRAGRRAAVTGAPGCGKTTLLKYLA